MRHMQSSGGPGNHRSHEVQEDGLTRMCQPRIRTALDCVKDAKRKLLGLSNIFPPALELNYEVRDQWTPAFPGVPPNTSFGHRLPYRRCPPFRRKYARAAAPSPTSSPQVKSPLPSSSSSEESSGTSIKSCWRRSSQSRFSVPLLRRARRISLSLS